MTDTRTSFPITLVHPDAPWTPSGAPATAPGPLPGSADGRLAEGILDSGDDRQADPSDTVPVAASETAEASVAPRRHRALRMLVVVLLGSLAVGATSAWGIAHRPHPPMAAALAGPVAEAWCSYNFPAPPTATADDPNLNTTACRLGFLDGAAHPMSESTPAERRVQAAESRAGARNPQGLWDIAYLAGWAAGHEAARAA